MRIFPIMVTKTLEQKLYIYADDAQDAIEQVNKQIENKDVKWRPGFKLNEDYVTKKDPIYDISILNEEKIDGDVNNIRALYGFPFNGYIQRRNIIVDVVKNTFIVLDEDLEDPTLTKEEDDETFDLRFPLTGMLIMGDSKWDIECVEIERYKKYSYIIINK